MMRFLIAQHQKFVFINTISMYAEDRIYNQAETLRKIVSVHAYFCLIRTKIRSGRRTA